MKLDDAVRALRDETSEAFEGADETRARVVAQVARARKRRAKRYFVVLPIAAVLAAGAASASVAGKLPLAWHAALRVLHGDVPAAIPAAPVRNEPMVPSVAPEPSAAPEPVAAPEPSATPAVEARPPIRASRKVTPPPAPVEIPAASAPASPAPADPLALYRQAHRLHFSGRDPAAALAAWDAYLREDPSGAFALEARYNRAICLVRLHRTDEAREALAPFADGRLGAYRQSEARALLRVLDGASPGE
jgi:hypothetical protein